MPEPDAVLIDVSGVRLTEAPAGQPVALGDIGGGQIVVLLRQIEVGTSQGKTIAIACREAGISEQSYFRWRKEYGALSSTRPAGS